MANLPSSKKRMRQEPERRRRNEQYKRSFRTLAKQVRSFAEQGDVEKARQLLPQAQRAFDKAAKTGVLKKGQASRKKARLARRVADAE